MAWQRTGPIKLDKLGRGLARLGVLHNDAATNAQVSVPPCAVKSAGILGNAELDIAIVSRLGAGRL